MNFDSIRLTFLSLFIIVTTRPFDNFPFTQILVVRNNTICISGNPNLGSHPPAVQPSGGLIEVGLKSQILSKKHGVSEEMSLFFLTIC